ncbi:MAG: alanine racemase [Bacteroidetes bacterium]|nr:alanine racemase [Bacteroidota bacterium]
MNQVHHSSRLEISRSAIQQNLKFLNRVIRKNVLISSVVKGNAYGHGIEDYIPLAEEAGYEHFSVFSAEEAYRVTQVSYKKGPIMIMGFLDDDAIDWAISHDIEFYIFNLDRMNRTLSIAKKRKKVAKIHLEVETGMNRTGVNVPDLDPYLELIKANPAHLHFAGLCTHFAGAESITNYYRIKQQQKQFEKAQNKVSLYGLSPERNHVACSAAALRYPKSQLDMVRLGIIQYGFFPTNEVLIEYLAKRKVSNNPLKRLISWKSRVMDVKDVKTGEFIGYGTSYLAGHPMKIAIVPIGYGQGFSRSLSNQGRVLIRGQRVPVIGTVNMNMLTIDITRLGGVELGDEVVLIGKQGDLEISVASFGELSDQLNYELLTRLPMDIPRLIVD